MTENRLKHSASPYLLQHANNPVDWWPWCDEALATAEKSGKPILLSVGYAACHWCHVMAHESFEDEDTARVMNERFVNIKVDREERPDIDQIYMAALHATGEQGGWPLTMFLTEKAEPFYGGTYFPNVARFGRPRFVDVLTAVADSYAAGAEIVSGNAEILRQHLMQTQAPGELPADAPEKAARQLLTVIDPVHGGTRGAPKFPNAGLFEVLWRAYARSGEEAYRDAVLRSANRIAMGGIYDHVGGGFARYAVDERWLVPHFEKMLYDNAQLIGLMSDAFCVTGDPLYRARIAETIAWAEREMAVDGLFAASLDADSEGEEGRFYVWSAAEIAEVLGAEAEAFMAAYAVTPGGNWEGTNVLNRLATDTLGDPATEDALAQSRQALLARRETRPRPGRDDKLLADWNGLMIAALAKAGASLAEPAWQNRAADTYAAAKATFGSGARLVHAVRGEARSTQGFALDYAGMIHAALALHAAGVGDGTALLTDAIAWVDTLETHHVAEHGGYHWTADDAPALIVRPDSPMDEAVPNANGLMVKNLATLWTLTGDERFESIALRILRAHARAAAQNVFGCASLFNGQDQLERLATVTALGAPRLLAAVRGSGHPAAIAVEAAPPGSPADGIALPAGEAIVCRSGVCSLPTGDDEALRQTLWRAQL
ncbi:thioredoxin domain-containing protein [Acuticoccus sp. MNP-M23]|uniref:thioredoxin domain-containing protein n=1 Tax=Acuticoccus sp. MNP-M23 TaxID=3072793 RepID=UPI00281595DC|nr:thioredoxin domain-containing protein [Acuticoccus sp. MNP-M23]WMS44282.1 thioredoxin domain-containing protein [Acuticoccus sp. MNP-M23]